MGGLAAQPTDINCQCPRPGLADCGRLEAAYAFRKVIIKSCCDTALVIGDTENSRWDRIYQIFGNRLRSDVLAAPHHGSEDAAHAGALRSIKPNTVLISAGYGNQYGHPHPQALRIYRSVAKQVYATNLREVGSHSRSVGSLFTTTNWEGIKTVKHR